MSRRLPGAAALAWVMAASAAGQTLPPLTSNRPGIGGSEALVARGVSRSRRESRHRVSRPATKFAGLNDLRVGAKLGVLTEPTNVITLSPSPAWSFPLAVTSTLTPSVSVFAEVAAALPAHRLSA